MDSSSDKAAPKLAIGKITPVAGTSDGTVTAAPPPTTKTLSAQFTTNSGDMPSRRVTLTHRECELISAFMVNAIGVLDAQRPYNERDLACRFTRNEMIQALAKIQPETRA